MFLYKIHKYYRSHSFFDFFRKVIYSFFDIISISKLYLKLKAYFILKTLNVKIGKNVRFNNLPNRISIGKKCLIYDNCSFEFSNTSELIIGENVVFSYGVVVCCNCKIEIGNNVQIGEYTSVRDTTHSYADPNVPIKFQKDIQKPVIIHDNVWIGRGCIIMPGTIVNSGVIIGANSVVKGNFVENSIYVGSPAKFVKKRF